MINIIVGKPGQGKTYLLTRLAVKFLKLGRVVYSNYFIDLEKLKSFGIVPEDSKIVYWISISELVNIKSGVILMDECQVYFNSRNWKNLPERLQYKLQQHRKHGLDIWGAVQNLKRIDTIVRELVSWVYKTKKIFNIFILNQFDPEDIDKQTRKSVSFPKIYFLNKKIADCYDTLQEIDFSKI